MNAAGPTGSTKSATPADGIRPAGRRVSMGDVARLAGVSAQTVSRVANGFPGVLDETRQQVLSAMTQLGYRPNSAARALKSGHFKTIGVIMFTLATTGNMRTLEAITDAALAEGYAITLLPRSLFKSMEAPSPESASRSWTRSSS